MYTWYGRRGPKVPCALLLPPAQAGRILLIGGGKASFSGGGDFLTLDPASQPRSAEILGTTTSPPTWTRILSVAVGPRMVLLAALASRTGVGSYW